MDQIIKNNKREKGQVALVMVLVMTVVSAVVVSVAGRLTTETRVQQLSKDSNDAFLTAQTGLEDALKLQDGLTGEVGEDKMYKVTLENKGQGGLLTDPLTPGTSLDVVLSGSASLQGVKIYWKQTTASASSLYVSRISGSEITDLAFDSSGSNGFTRVTSGGSLNGVEFTHATSIIPLTPSIEKMRISVYGGTAILGIEPIGDLLPIQVVSYKSEGTVGTGDEKIKYGLNYEESKDKRTPEVFDYALFSFGSIIQ